MNPYLAGVLLGLVLLASFLILGVGLGASASIARAGAFVQSCVMPQHVADSAYFGGWGKDPLRYYLVFMFVGTLLGGLVSAIGDAAFSRSLNVGRRRRAVGASRWRWRAAFSLASRAGWLQAAPRVRR